MYNQFKVNAELKQDLDRAHEQIYAMDGRRREAARSAIMSMVGGNDEALISQTFAGWQKYYVIIVFFIEHEGFGLRAFFTNMICSIESARLSVRLESV